MKQRWRKVLRGVVNTIAPNVGNCFRISLSSKNILWCTQNIDLTAVQIVARCLKENVTCKDITIWALAVGWRRNEGCYVCWELFLYEDKYKKNKARIFLLVDLRDFFSDLGLRGRKKRKEKKLWKWPVNWSFSELLFLLFFQSVFFFFFFLNISRKN